MGRLIKTRSIFQSSDILYFLKGYVKDFIKWSSGGIITNISNLKAPTRMSELHCEKSVNKHYGERESGAQFYILSLVTFILTGYKSQLQTTKRKTHTYTHLKTHRASLVAQWLGVCLLMQGTRVRALVWEDPTCHGAAGPVSHND